MNPKTFILSIDFQTLSWFGILTYLLSHVKAEGSLPPLSNLEPSEKCPKIMCTAPPTDVPCNKSMVSNPTILARLGSLKDCCSAYKCQEKDGSISTYFGISGEENYNDIATNITLAPPKEKCDLITCPKPVETDTPCAVSNALDASDYKPRGDLQNCCPLYNCTKPEDNSYHTRYVLQAGKMPTDPAAIATEKGNTAKRAAPEGTTTEKGNTAKRAAPEGTTTTSEKCPAIRCAPKPTTSSCEKTFEKFSSSLEKLGEFKECCPMWKCVFDDGAYFTHFEITSKNFWMAETSYFSATAKIGPAPGSKPGISDSAKPAGRSANSVRNPPTTTEKQNPTTPTTPSPKNNQQQQQQQAIVQMPQITISSKDSNKKPANESTEESDEEEEDPSVKVGKMMSSIGSQQQQSGNGNQQQQQQQLVIMQPLIINKYRKEPKTPVPTTPPTTTTTEEEEQEETTRGQNVGLLGLKLGELKL